MFSVPFETLKTSKTSYCLNPVVVDVRVSVAMLLHIFCVPISAHLTRKSMLVMQLWIRFVMKLWIRLLEFVRKLVKVVHISSSDVDATIVAAYGRAVVVDVVELDVVNKLTWTLLFCSASIK